MGDKKVIAYIRSYRLIEGGKIHETRGTISIGAGMSASRAMDLHQRKMDRTWGTTTTLRWKVCDSVINGMVSAAKL